MFRVHKVYSRVLLRHVTVYFVCPVWKSVFIHFALNTFYFYKFYKLIVNMFHVKLCYLVHFKEKRTTKVKTILHVFCTASLLFVSTNTVCTARFFIQTLWTDSIWADNRKSNVSVQHSTFKLLWYAPLHFHAVLNSLQLLEMKLLLTVIVMKRDSVRYTVMSWPAWFLNRKPRAHIQKKQKREGGKQLILYWAGPRRGSCLWLVTSDDYQTNHTRILTINCLFSIKWFYMSRLICKL